MARKILLLSVVWAALVCVALATEEALAVNTITPTSDGNATTLIPGGNETTTPPSQTTPKNPCMPNPCFDGSTCQSGPDDGFSCLCLVGEMYNNSINLCVPSRVFPSEFQTTEPYKEEMENKDSKEFLELSEKIISDTEKRLVGLTFYDILVLDLLPSGTALRSEGQTVTAILQIVFLEDSDITTEKVSEALEKECTDCIVKGTIKLTKLCTAKPCDEISTECSEVNGKMNCTCRPGYTLFDGDRVCAAKCPFGQQLKEDTCTDCAFGYTGFNCEESWKLNVVIVGGVLGGLLLISIIISIVLAVKKPKKSSKKSKKSDVGKSSKSQPPVNTSMDNSNFDFNRAAAGNRSTNGVGNGNSNFPQIPRATANSGWGSRTNLEMTPSNSRQNLIPPSRSQNNPYAQSRPQVNPYGQSQGRPNGYYM